MGAPPLRVVPGRYPPAPPLGCEEAGEGYDGPAEEEPQDGLADTKTHDGDRDKHPSIVVNDERANTWRRKRRRRKRRRGGRGEEEEKRRRRRRLVQCSQRTQHSTAQHH